MFRFYEFVDRSNFLCQRKILKWIDDCIIYPFLNNLPVPKGILFHGDPGNGKTVCAQNLSLYLSTQTGKKWSFFSHSCSSFLQKYIGNGEAALKKVFEEVQPFTVLFFDEIDAICSSRKNDSEQCYVTLTSTFLSLLNDVDKNVIVIGATNRIHCIDVAFKRYGRFEHEIVFNNPDRHDRFLFLKHFLKDHIYSANLSILAKNTVGYTIAQLKCLVEKSVLLCSKDGELEMKQHHFNENLIKCPFSSIFLKKISVVNVKISTLFIGTYSANVGRALMYLHSSKDILFLPRLGTRYFENRGETEQILDDARFSNKIIIAYEEFDWFFIESYFEKVIHVPCSEFAI